MDSKRATRLSKFMSYALRHRPDAVGIRLDDEGWVSIADLLAAAEREGLDVSDGELRQLVADSDKQRFAIDDTGRRIRANQGHSVSVALGLDPLQPPVVLWHGTVARFLPAIREEGLVKGQRQHVHLSADQETARQVGQRRGQPVLLRIEAGAMQRAGFEFFCSENGVWLVNRVPREFLVEGSLP